MGDSSIAARFRRGQLCRLTEDINCIPQGIYRFHGYRAPMLYFKVSGDVLFSISDDGVGKIEPLPLDPSITERTRQSHFVRRYAKLLRASRSRPNDPSAPFTFCIMDPSVKFSA